MIDFAFAARLVRNHCLVLKFLHYFAVHVSCVNKLALNRMILTQQLHHKWLATYKGLAFQLLLPHLDLLDLVNFSLLL